VSQSSSTEEAVTEILAVDGVDKTVRKREPLQPLLFRCRGQYFVLADRIAVPISDASCFADAVECLFSAFFVNVHYPQELKYFYCHIKKMFGLPESLPNSTVLTDFQRKLQPYLSSD